jgi:hypothetical protein
MVVDAPCYFKLQQLFTAYSSTNAFLGNSYLNKNQIMSFSEDPFKHLAQTVSEWFLLMAKLDKEMLAQLLHCDHTCVHH